MNQIIKLTELFTAVVKREVGALEAQGIVSITGDEYGKIIIHVTPDYFDEHFEGRYEATTECWPKHGKVKHAYTTPSGNEIFCLKKAIFERVA